MRWTPITVCWAVLLLSGTEHATPATPESVSCDQVIGALKIMSEVETLDERAGHFAYRRGGSIDVLCPVGGSPDLIIGVSPLPGPEFWPFFGRLAHAVGVDPSEAIKAAQECRRNAEEQFRRNGNGRLTRGEPTWTDTLHVDCRVSEKFISFGVFKPPQ
jgi:hypothetical protein